MASKAGAVYFVEVKYRGSVTWGDGLDYVTPRKLQQMQFAAQFWVAVYKHSGAQYVSAIALTGQPPRVTAWLPEV